MAFKHFNMKIQEIEKDLKQLSKLRFKDKEKKFKSFENVIDEAIGKIEGYDQTGKSTYYDKGGLQCEEGRNRGIADLYRLSLYYFPKTKLKQVVNYVMETYSSSFCHNTNQTVIRPNHGRRSHSSIYISIRLKNRKRVNID